VFFCIIIVVYFFAGSEDAGRRDERIDALRRIGAFRRIGGAGGGGPAGGVELRPAGPASGAADRPLLARLLPSLVRRPQPHVLDRLRRRRVLTWSPTKTIGSSWTALTLTGFR